MPYHDGGWVPRVDGDCVAQGLDLVEPERRQVQRGARLDQHGESLGPREVRVLGEIGCVNVHLRVPVHRVCLGMDVEISMF